MFGVAEDHDSNPLKIGISKLKKRGARFVSVNPVRTGYSAVADNWIGIRPGTDGLLILSRGPRAAEGAQDRRRLSRCATPTRPGWSSMRPGTADHGLFARDADGKPLVFETRHRARRAGRHARARGRRCRAATSSTTGASPCRPSSFSPKNISIRNTRRKPSPPRPASPPTTIRGLAAEIARVAFDEAIIIDQPWTDMNGERHESFVGRPVSFHAMRGISAHSNGFQTARALHLLQVLIGAVDCPGGFRFEPPYPKPVEAHPTPHGRAEHFGSNKPLSGPHLGFPRGPEDLLIDADGRPNRIDKAFSWDAPLVGRTG